MHVDADLVGAPGVEVAEDERGFVGRVGDENFVVGDGCLSSGWIEDRHFHAIDRVATDVGEDGSAFRQGAALNDGEVALVGGAVGELLNERTVGGVGLGDDQAAGGVFVEAVNDAGSFDTADPGELAFAMMEQGVDQSAIGIAGGGVDDHAFVFVDDDERVVFIEDAQRDFLGLGVGRDGLGDFDLDAIADGNRIARLCGLAVFADVLLADELLNA